MAAPCDDVIFPRFWLSACLIWKLLFCDQLGFGSSGSDIRVARLGVLTSSLLFRLLDECFYGKAFQTRIVLMLIHTNFRVTPTETFVATKAITSCPDVNGLDRKSQGQRLE